MCLIRVADNKNGEGAKPNKISANQNSINSLSPKLLKSISLIFLSHKNLTQSRSSGCKLICRKAFSRSPTIEILCTLKRKRTPNNIDICDGPAHNQSLSEVNHLLLHLYRIPFLTLQLLCHAVSQVYLVNSAF